MATLTIARYQRCYNALLRCEQFQSQDRLLSVFAVAELSAYQNGLPDAGSKEDRVSQVIDYLGKQSADNGRSVLGLLLESLRARCRDPQLSEELDLLHAEIEPHTTREEPIKLCFVVMAMTRSETAQLNGQVEMHADQLPEAAERLAGYGETREDWRPFPDESDKNISEVVLETIDTLNLFRANEGIRPLHAISYTDLFFAADIDTRSETYEKLILNGCVLVIDPLSLFHDGLIAILKESELVSHKDRVAILVLSPPALSHMPIYQRVRSELNKHLPHSKMRDSTISDTFFEFGISDTQALQRRLFTMLPAAAQVDAGLRADPRRAAMLQRKLAKEPQQIQRAFPGRRTPQ
jgi:hypothetical protein